MVSPIGNQSLFIYFLGELHIFRWSPAGLPLWENPRGPSRLSSRRLGVELVDLVERRAPQRKGQEAWLRKALATMESHHLMIVDNR